MKRLVICEKCGYAILRPVTDACPIVSLEADHAALSGHFARTPWGCVDAKPYAPEGRRTTFFAPASGDA